MLSNHLAPWPKERKVTIMRGNKEQGIEGSCYAPIGFGFDIISESALPILPIKLQYVGSGARPDKHFTGKHSPVGLRCEFDEPKRPSVASLTCKIPETWNLGIDLSFDFDSRPCALVYRERSNRRL